MAEKAKMIEKPVDIPRPRIEVLERALANPFGVPAGEVHLKDPALVCRWVNTDISHIQFAKMKEWGYLPARPEYLLNIEDVPHTLSPDGYVTRGGRGGELLMYTTKENAKNRAWAKTQLNRRRMNPHVTKQEVLEAASGKLGSEASDFLAQRIGPVGGVTDSHEIIERTRDGEE